MKLRRFEFGLGKSTDDTVQVQALRGDGTIFVKSFPASHDVLAHAEADFATNGANWSILTHHPDSPGLSEIWTGNGALFVSGEAAITSSSLQAHDIDLIVSMSKIKPDTRQEIENYLHARPGATHLETPILDVLARHQDAASASNAAKALTATTDGVTAGQRVLVHCLMGIHRSVAIATVALRHAGQFQTTRDAFLHIKTRRHISGWNPESIAWLDNLAPPTAGRP